MLKVYEHFLSLQGESTFAGQLCYFIRLSGCNLRCSYCDTTMAQELDSGRDMSIDELVELAVNSGSPLVEVTGGEPLMQKETSQLLQALLDAKLEVLLETNGAIDIGCVPQGVHRIVDYKLSSCGMAEKMLAKNFLQLTANDEVKFVIANRSDYDEACEIIERYNIAKQSDKILFSPVWGSVEFEDLASWIVADKLPVRMQIQMHKIIWGADRNGV